MVLASLRRFFGGSQRSKGILEDFRNVSGGLMGLPSRSSRVPKSSTSFQGVSVDFLVFNGSVIGVLDVPGDFSGILEASSVFRGIRRSRDLRGFQIVSVVCGFGGVTIGFVTFAEAF